MPLDISEPCLGLKITFKLKQPKICFQINYFFPYILQDMHICKIHQNNICIIYLLHFYILCVYVHCFLILCTIATFSMLPRNIFNTVSTFHNELCSEHPINVHK